VEHVHVGGAELGQHAVHRIPVLLLHHLWLKQHLIRGMVVQPRRQLLGVVQRLLSCAPIEGQRVESLELLKVFGPLLDRRALQELDPLVDRGDNLVHVLLALLRQLHRAAPEGKPAPQLDLVRRACGQLLQPAAALEVAGHAAAHLRAQHVRYPAPGLAGRVVVQAARKEPYQLQAAQVPFRRHLEVRAHRAADVPLHRVARPQRQLPLRRARGAGGPLRCWPHALKAG